MDEQERQSFGRLLRTFRLSAGLTQEELAERAGLTANGISMLERGVRQHPQPYTVRQLAAALELSTGDRDRLVASASGGLGLLAQSGTTIPQQAARIRQAGSASRLPAPLTRLVGRKQEIIAVSQLLAKARLVTLTGAGGSGKTRLAIAVAHRLHEKFDSGAHFISLASIDRPELVELAIERALDAVRAEGATPVERIICVLGDQPILLVLDNLEQVVEAAPLISTLLAALRNLRVLATSRIPLHLYGEQEYRVPPLALPDTDDIDHVGRSEAVQLFLQAARANRQDFTPDLDELETIAAICLRLDGLPLAIELAAARIRLFSPEELLDRLMNRVEPLTGAGWGLPERQQTLRRTFDWSYGLLSPDQQRRFSQLGVFAGSFRPDDASTVLSGEPGTEKTLDLLADLFDNGLLERVGGPGKKLRFAMLQTVREYALARLAESGELAAAQRRHAEHYLALAEEAAPALTGPDQAAWLSRLEREQDNLRAALQWAEERGEAETMLRLTSTLWRFWELSWRLDEGRSWLEQALALAPDQAPEITSGAALQRTYLNARFGLGCIAFYQDDYPAARRQQRTLLAQAQAAGDDEYAAAALTQLGHIARNTGDYDEAQAYYEGALQVRRKGGDDREIAISLGSLGWVAFARQDFEGAAHFYEESGSLFRALGSWREVILTQCRLGRAYAELGQMERAHAVMRECLELQRQHETTTDASLIWVQLGSIAWLEGDADQALGYHRKGLRDYWRYGHQRGPTPALEGAALALIALGDHLRGVHLLAAARELRSPSGTVIQRPDRVAYEDGLNQARAALGQAALEMAWAAGRRLTLEQAIDEALRE